MLQPMPASPPHQARRWQQHVDGMEGLKGIRGVKDSFKLQTTHEEVQKAKWPTMELMLPSAGLKRQHGYHFALYLFRHDNIHKASTDGLHNIISTNIEIITKYEHTSWIVPRVGWPGGGQRVIL